MLEPGGDPDLAQEPLGTNGRREVRSQDLDGDHALVAKVGRAIHHRHAAGSEWAFDAVSVGNSGRECPGDGVVHEQGKVLRRTARRG
jgi:hypothetical protein